MATRYWYDKQLDCFWFKPEGRESRESYFGAVRAMFEHESYSPGKPAIWDLRDSDMAGVDRELAEGNAAVQLDMSDQRGEAKIAIIVKDEFGFAKMRMYLGHGSVSHLNVEMFYDEQAAKTWIKGD